MLANHATIADTEAASSSRHTNESYEAQQQSTRERSAQEDEQEQEQDVDDKVYSCSKQVSKSNPKMILKVEILLLPEMMVRPVMLRMMVCCMNKEKNSFMIGMSLHLLLPSLLLSVFQ